MLGYKNKKMIPDSVYYSSNHPYGFCNYNSYNNFYYSNNMYNRYCNLPITQNVENSMITNSKSKWDLNYKYQNPNVISNYPSFDIFKNYFNLPVGANVLSPNFLQNNKIQNQEKVALQPIKTNERPVYSQNNFQYDYSKEKKVKRCGVIFIIKTPDNIIENFKILVVKGVSGIWSFPKGRCMPNEEEDACAKREVYEETGLEIDNLKDKKKFKIGRNIYFRYDCVENEFTKFTVHDTNEVEEVGWKTIHELRQMVCNKDIRSLINYQSRLYTYHSNVFN